MNAPIVTARTRAPFDRDAAERFLSSALLAAAADRVIAIVRFPAPRAPLEALAGALRKGTAMSWRAPDGTAIVAQGSCITIALEGDDRFGALERARLRLFGAARRTTHPDAPDAAPRLFGGWAFATGGASDEPWDGFGDGRFFLPRWTYERHGHGATLTAAVDLRDGWTGRFALARAELGSVWDALRRVPHVSPPPDVVGVAHLDIDRYADEVRAITEAIARGEVSKIVAARRADVTADRDLDPWSILRTLSARYPDTWRFGVRFGAGTLVAATPERLFVKRGRIIEADALAGSIAAGLEDAEARLHASEKDLREHRPVVEHLLRRLRPLCEHLDDPGPPVIRRLPNVLHLHTAIRGRLRDRIDATTLVQTLHPTPAVGGVPGEEATRWIAAHEAHPRGWYCGPVGWIDADGDAEMAVALRCGVVRGASAWLWAGGGIVEGSEPDAEYRESALKLRPLLNAIGAR